MDAGRTRDGCRQHFHGNMAKKQLGSSPERRKGSGETWLLGRAPGHRSSSIREELVFTPQGTAVTNPLCPGSSQCSGDPVGRARGGVPHPSPVLQSRG